jgi:pyruvate kinase
LNPNINKEHIDENDLHLSITNNPYEQLGNNLYDIYKQVIQEVEKVRDNFKMDDKMFENEKSRDNLLCYLALRKNNIEHIQIGLAENGLSSLGRLEDNVLISLEQVLKHFGYFASMDSNIKRTTYDEAKYILSNRSKSLLGRSRKERTTRIMVTLDIDTAYQPQLLEELLKNGMDIARINCAYYTTIEWKMIIDAVRNAEKRLIERGQDIGRKCRIIMDLGGPKIRVNNMSLESRPLKITVPKDIHGRPRRLVEGLLDGEAKYTEKTNLTGVHSSFVISISKRKEELSNVKVGEKLSFIDSRGRLRSLRVLERINERLFRIGIEKTIYIQDGITLYHEKGSGNIVSSSTEAAATIPNIDYQNAKENQSNIVIGPVRPYPIDIEVKAGDKLLLYRNNINGHSSTADKPAGISCSIPEILNKVKLGHRVLIDDGKIGSIVSLVNDEYLELNIIHPSDTVGKIKSNKGLNFPDSNLNLSAITSEDIKNLKFIVKHANAVAISFAHSPEDITLLTKELLKLGYPDFGIIAKIETRISIYNLTKILLAGLDVPKFGILIARGDLAVEIGYENLSQIQEDILCLCDAAHIPVILATQVLETLAKSGVPTRAEIIDAARGQRAECVMLNKGKYVIEAVKILSSLLKTEERHNIKKRQIFREFIEQYGVFDK